MTDIFQPLTLASGATLKNRFILAPLTNSQSHIDGTLSDDEYHWLTQRAVGGFSLTMTCAAHVQAAGQGFPGQLGIFSDHHLEGLSRLAEGIKEHDSVSLVQLHHAGMRSPTDLIGEPPLCPSDNEEYGARAMTTEEVEQLGEDFITAAERAEKAGFEGVEIHGAHGYILAQFLSGSINQRQDQYGGSVENRGRLIRDIIDGIRARCSSDFILGLRLSPERFDVELGDIIDFTRTVLSEGKIDFLDMSLWDVFKEPVEEAFKGRTLLSYFTELERGNVALGIAGKLRTPEEIRQAMAADIDFVLLGRAAILHHDYPKKMQADGDFQPVSNPVSAEHLRSEGLSETFVNYMRSWKGFVAE
ncbi:NADH-dependent flavin oxidoreductase [marine gamma proteobacterium HTCC2207]|jgi:2,4-dienoyl-CoA reductase-like NADH-dependent reductase (Old Yellow Enzyme family)|uniref:NADH-dependent flavin oxidoreductase n=1 Tax=gamma proteobacterium HTCC2207 TaxID=314287 RepID=Q1YU81_9GAMM|nr:NADH-dependent flavin oxidoreductase [marine gamma proteobacterium HTCC2207] [gamma proteobacterium HTCC2207]MBT5105295.1 NADH:flavin oxidoreductase [Porticoccaceae bacterium]MBT6115626.1 NADH:flavin oxidoreductase [Porticoccaceae bacterium]MBT6593989.1 NADH:flavin oxidoreductase [Porticoccaceae bacterium]MDB4426852.1 NADH:flavin oxidoreductase [Porticoccaceae bacterium]